jgi:hypothetical protein
MPDPRNIDDVFDQLKQLFNEGRYDDMKQFLHPNITWKMLHHADSFTGADKVIQWLKDNKAALNPQFDPDPNKNKTPNPEDSSLRVDGSAKWQASKGSPNVENIEYHYTFTKSQTGSWLLSNAFGVVLG